MKIERAYTTCVISLTIYLSRTYARFFVDTAAKRNDERERVREREHSNPVSAAAATAQASKYGGV